MDRLLERIDSVLPAPTPSERIREYARDVSLQTENAKRAIAALQRAVDQMAALLSTCESSIRGPASNSAQEKREEVNASVRNIESALRTNRHELNMLNLHLYDHVRDFGSLFDEYKQADGECNRSTAERALLDYMDANPVPQTTHRR